LQLSDRRDGRGRTTVISPGCCCATSIRQSSFRTAILLTPDPGDALVARPGRRLVMPIPSDVSYRVVDKGDCGRQATGLRPLFAWSLVAALAASGIALGAGWTAQAAVWTAQPAPGPSGPVDSSFASVSCASATSCMAVGNFDGGLDTSTLEPVEPIGAFAARWDGTSWVLVPTASGGSDPKLVSISCASVTFCTAVGMTQTQVGTRHYRTRALVEMWNGRRWTTAPAPTGSARFGSLTGVACTSNTFCVAVGSPRDIAWHGRRWQQTRIPSVRYGSSMAAVACSASDRCTAVGSYNLSKSGVANLQPLAAEWNGHRWTIQRPPAERLRYRGKLLKNYTYLNGVSCPSRSFCLASGEAERAQQGVEFAAFADLWNGRGWVRATSGLPHNSPFNAVSCVAANSCYAAGQYDTGVSPVPATVQPLIESWSPARWARVTLPEASADPLRNRFPSGTAMEHTPDLAGIACVPLHGCTAVGNQSQGLNSVTLVDSDLG
jgi:hypothetical protein